MAFPQHQLDCLDEEYENNVDNSNTGFEGLSKEESKERVKWLWFNLYLKAKGSAGILKTFNDLNHQILQYGTKRGLIVNKDEEFKPLWFIITPNSYLKKVWNIVVMILLVYTASYAPFRMAFIDDVSTSVFIFESFIDLLFFIDLCVNLVSAYQRSDGTIEYRWKEILLNYAKGWLILDCIASFPFQVLDLVGANTGSGQYNTLRKLARLPRLARLFRVLRIIKLVKMMKNNKAIQNTVEKLSLNPGIMRLFTTLLIVSVLVHVYSCLWFLQSKFQNHGPDTWVARYDARETETKIQYLTAIYWSCQLLTTVGYGDFGVGNRVEIIMSIIWMALGVAFYSFVIGNIQSIITKIDEDTEDLVIRLKALEKFKKQHNLKESIYIRIKKFLEQNYSDLKWTMDFDEFLPATLNDEILTHIYGDTVNNIAFFNEMPKKDFVWSILPFLQSIKIEYGDIIYSYRDLAKEMYFIKAGSVRIYYKEHKVGTIEEGDYFGEVEMFFNINREFTAKAHHDCILLVIQKKQLENVLIQFPDVKNEMLNVAKEKRERYYEVIVQRNLPMPKNTLDVYGVPNLVADENIKCAESVSPKIDDEKLEIKPRFSKFRASKTKKSSPNPLKELEEQERNNKLEEKKIKSQIRVPEPMNMKFDQINPLESQELDQVGKALDQKLSIQKEFSHNIPDEVEMNETDVIKLLQNYNEDMELIYLSNLIILNYSYMQSQQSHGQDLVEDEQIVQ